MANLKKCDFMVHPNELRKCIIEIDEVWHELSQQQRYLAEITNQIHGHAHAHMSIDIIEQQECVDVRELMAGLCAIHTFYEKNGGMITGN